MATATPQRVRRNKWRFATRIFAVTLMWLEFIACTTEPSYSVFKQVPQAEGWGHTMPLVFAPQIEDSSATYDLEVAIRHTNSYEYRNLFLMIDLMDDSAHVQQRRMVKMELADAYGNWLGTGFGSVFQCRSWVAKAVNPSALHRVVIWQTMGGDSLLLKGITDVGVIMHRTN